MVPLDNSFLSNILASSISAGAVEQEIQMQTRKNKMKVFFILQNNNKKGSVINGALNFYAASFSFFLLIWVTSESKASSKDSSNDLEEAFTKKF